MASESAEVTAAATDRVCENCDELPVSLYCPECKMVRAATADEQRQSELQACRLNSAIAVCLAVCRSSATDAMQVREREMLLHNSRSTRESPTRRPIRILLSLLLCACFVSVCLRSPRLSVCGADFHKPAKKASHVRKARFPTAVADILRKVRRQRAETSATGEESDGAQSAGQLREHRRDLTLRQQLVSPTVDLTVPFSPCASAALSRSLLCPQCEKEGKASDYGASKPEGKNILKYVLEYEEGYYYLFKNNSTSLHLDAELEFKMSNLHIVGFENATKVKVSLPPASLQYVHLQRKDPTQSCNCEITQRFALNPPKVGKLPSVYVPVTYTADSPIDVLKAQTEKEGICTDHGTQDPAGLTIHQYQWVSG